MAASGDSGRWTHGVRKIVLQRCTEFLRWVRGPVVCGVFREGWGRPARTAWDRRYERGSAVRLSGAPGSYGAALGWAAGVMEYRRPGKSPPRAEAWFYGCS